jgi:hypothetical protein
MEAGVLRESVLEGGGAGEDDRVISVESAEDEVAELVEDGVRAPAIEFGEPDAVVEIAGAADLPEHAWAGPVDIQALAGGPAHLPLQALPAQAGQRVIDEKGSAQIFVLDRDIQNVRSGVQLDGFGLMEITSPGGVLDGHALVVLGVNTQDDAEGESGGDAEGIGAIIARVSDAKPHVDASNRGMGRRRRNRSRSGGGLGQPAARAGLRFRLVPEFHPHATSGLERTGMGIPVMDSP